MDPNRLANEGDANERALLESLRSDLPSDEARAGMWKAIAAQAAVVGVASTASAATTKVGVATKVGLAAWAPKLAVVIAVSAVGAGAALLHRAPPAPTAQAAKVTRPLARSEAPAKAEPAFLSEEAEAEAAAARVVQDALDRARPFGSQDTCVEIQGQRATGCSVTSDFEAVLETKRPKRPLQKDAQKEVEKRAEPRVEKPVVVAPPLDALKAESQLLGQARSRLRAGDLAGAEATLNDARDRFPQGALGQEREVMQIELLAALGDRDGADHRARRFLRKHPDSPHAKSVQRFLISP